MTRTRLLMATLLACACLGAAQETKKEPPPAQEPPEEDESLVTKEYSFNPLQASKEIRTGLFYFKRGSYKAAAARFEEATRWDPGSAEAYLRLGEAREKLKDNKAARAAFTKYLELAPNAKNAALIRRKLTGKP